jgi:hypothetical protein
VADIQFRTGQQTVGSIVTQCDSDSVGCRIVAGGVCMVQIGVILPDSGTVGFGSWTGV